MIVTKFILVSLLGLAGAAPLGFFGTKTLRIQTAPVATGASYAEAAPAPLPAPAPVKNVVQVPVVQVDKAQVVDGVNRATGSIVGIISNIANAVGQIVSQTVRDVGQLAQSLPPPQIIRKTIPLPQLPVITKTVVTLPPITKTVVTLPPPPPITKTIPVPVVQFQTVTKTIG